LWYLNKYLLVAFLNPASIERSTSKKPKCILYRTSLKAISKHLPNRVHDFWGRGGIEAVKFKAIRVPMGIYEQRKNGTFMVRVRCAAGMITPGQLKELALIAGEKGTEPIHITTQARITTASCTTGTDSRNP
jgi:sulfite reductase beta subunit-like hemoprotein